MNGTVWIPGSMSRIFPGTRSPAHRTSPHVELIAGRNHYECFQIAVAAGKETVALSATASDLMGPKGTAIPAAAIEFRHVGLVPVLWHTRNTPADELEGETPGMFPDYLDAQAEITMPANQARSLWVTVHVPADAAPGAYRGRITLKLNKATVKVPVLLNVLACALPRKSHSYATFWISPTSILRWHHLTQEDEEYWKILSLYAKDMAEHRQDTIISYLFYNPGFSEQTVKIIRERDGSYSYDFSLWLRWVETFLRAGFNLIEIGHISMGWMVKGAWPFQVYDRAKNRMEFVRDLPILSPRYRTIVGGLLVKLGRILKDRGWSKRAILHVADEPMPEPEVVKRYRALGVFARQCLPDIPQIDANSNLEMAGETDIWVPVTEHYQLFREGFEERRRMGERIWWYTCCGPAGRHANRFMDFPLLKTRMLSWLGWRFNIEGYLHWGLNSWARTSEKNAAREKGARRRIEAFSPTTDCFLYSMPDVMNPYYEVSNSLWGPGDQYIVYPPRNSWEVAGPVSSTRWEITRQGLQDREYLWQFDQAIQRSDAKPETLAAARRLRAEAVRRAVPGLITYTRDPVYLLGLRNRVMTAIAGL